MPSAPADKYLLFLVAGQSLAFPLEAVRELLPIAAVTRPADAPAWLHGFLRLGPETLPVVELAPLLGLPQSARSLQSHFVRMIQGPLWLVDRVEQIVQASALTPLPPEHFINEYAAGSFPAGGGEVIVLRPESLLLAEERERIGQIARRERARREEARSSVDA